MVVKIVAIVFDFQLQCFTVENDARVHPNRIEFFERQRRIAPKRLGGSICDPMPPGISTIVGRFFLYVRANASMRRACVSRISSLRAFW
jgi:hypothetical protein